MSNQLTHVWDGLRQYADVGSLDEATKVAIVAFLLGLGLLRYVLGSLGLMRIAQRRGMGNAYLAWIPFGHTYLLTMLATGKENLGYGFILLELVTLLRQFRVFSAIGRIGRFVMLYELYKKMSNKAILMIIITVLTFGVMGPIFLFAIRNNEFQIEEA